MPRVSVIVPARDAEPTLPALLAALRAQSVEHELIVADDGSRDATRALAERAGATLVAVPAAPAGPSAARNAAAAAAGGDILAFTDADCEPEPGWLAAAVAAIEAGADLVQGPVIPAAPPGPFDRTVSLGAPSPLYETANLVVRAAAFEAVGGFEGWLLPERSKELGEDAWLGWRLRRAGCRVAWAPEAVVRHAVFARDARGFVAERARLRYFPALAARIPELRSALLYRRLFLTRRSAAFDAALAGAGAALLRRSPLALAAAVPYAALVAREARAWGHMGPRVAAAGLAADAVGCAALIAGSVRERSPVI